MAELEERVERLEGDLADMKAGIKDLLIELKVLMARNHNPLADQNADNQPSARARDCSAADQRDLDSKTGLQSRRGLIPGLISLAFII